VAPDPHDDAEMRRRILLTVEAYPGLHLRAIQRRARTSAMLAEYHLNVLENLGLITSHIERGYRRFFPVRTGPLHLDATDKRWLGLLRRPPVLGITLLLLEKSPLAAVALAELSGMPLSTSLYQLKQMQAAGLIGQEREAGRTKVVLADRARVLEILRAYRPTPDVLTRYAELWSRVFQTMGSTRSRSLPTPTAEPPDEPPLPIRVANSTQSVQRVYGALLEGPLTGQELVALTGLARRTVYAALAHLDSWGFLRKQGHLKDMRQTKFWIEDRPPQDEPQS
jgi:DNA-binding transcriptional regulator GbsR (MarR family)/DNA-binding transcriptional ArsR family regulator